MPPGYHPYQQGYYVQQPGYYCPPNYGQSPYPMRQAYRQCPPPVIYREYPRGRAGGGAAGSGGNVLLALLAGLCAGCCLEDCLCDGDLCFCCC